MRAMNPLGDEIPKEQRDALGAEVRKMMHAVRLGVRDLTKRKRHAKLGHLIADAGNNWINASSGRKHWACVRGCSYCCSLGVPVTPPEAFLIAEALLAGCSPVELEEVKATLRDRAAQASAATSAKDYMARRIRCAFLTEDESCGIHDARPIACKAYASFDRDSCRDFVNGGPFMISDDMAGIIGGGILAAFQEAIRAAYLDGDVYELQGAVLIALEPGSFDRWVAGRRVFKGCSVYATKPE